MNKRLSRQLAWVHAFMALDCFASFMLVRVILYREVYEGGRQVYRCVDVSMSVLWYLQGCHVSAPPQAQVEHAQARAQGDVVDDLHAGGQGGG